MADSDMSRCSRRGARSRPSGCAPYRHRETRQRTSRPHSNRPASRILGEPIPIIRQKGVHEIPKYMVDRDVTLLNAMDAVGTNHQAVVEVRGQHFSTVASGKTNRPE